jgi:hypothetical protein
MQGWNNIFFSGSRLWAKKIHSGIAVFCSIFYNDITKGAVSCAGCDFLCAAVPLHAAFRYFFCHDVLIARISESISF